MTKREHDNFLTITIIHKDKQYSNNKLILDTITEWPLAPTIWCPKEAVTTLGEDFSALES
jgi:hypothetical protein